MALVIACGAFGAHALADIEPRLLAIWQKAVWYHGLNSLGMLVLTVSGGLSKLMRVAMWLLLLGIILFSGSLYAYVLLESKWLVMLTPIGGLLFIMAWLMAGVAGYQSHAQRESQNER